ncbi:calymmin isoform X4 [Micropterus dolomieu]|uniref:calymmin isoform X4 n=1 Tax=Micropterus dolomieu TaxID=147949 RepID=UPI001E8E1F51|nr:calymmin isoform X4 [Micropterus dolomieu]
MLAQLLLQGAVILWLVQTAHTGGYGPAYGVSNGHGPQPNGKKPQNGGGIGRMLMPSKGVGQAMGAQNGYGGYPTKGIGYGAAAGSTNKGGMKGNGATAGVINGQGGKLQGGNPAVLPNGNGATSNGYGVQASLTNGQPMKGIGYGAQAGGYDGQGTKGNGYGAAAAAHKGLGTKGNGYGVQAGPTNGQQMKGNGYGAPAAVAPNGNGGHLNGHGIAAAAHKGPGTKGNGQGAAVWTSSSKGPRPNGQEEAGSKPMKGYGRPPYGAGPGVGMGASRGLGVPQLARNQAYGRNGHNGYGAQPMGGYNGGYGSAGLGLGPRYRNGGMKGPKQGNGATRGGAMRPQPGYGNGAVPNGYGAKPNGYGAAAGAGAGVPNIYGTKPNGGNGITNGAALGGYGNKLNGYGVTAGVSNGQLAANTDYGMISNEKGTKGAGVSYEKGLKGGVLSPEQTSATPEEGVVPQQAITRGAAPVAPEPTSGILVMVTQDKYQKLPSPVPQGKSYKQTPLIPQATPEPAPAIPQAKDPMPAPEFTPEPAPIGPQGKGPKAATSGPAPEVPQTIPAHEPAVVLPQENGGGPSISKGQGAKAAKPDCRPSGVPNGQWMKIPRPGYNEGAGASTGTNTKGKDASKGGLINGGGAKASKPGYEAGGYAVPGLSNGYGGLGYPYTGKPQQPGYQGAYLGARYGHSYGGNTGLGETSKSKSGNGNGYSAGVQPDYASFGQGGSAANGKSGGARQIPYNGAPVVPVGLDGVSQFEPQSAGLAPNGKLSSMYGGMGDLPFGGQPLGMGSEKLNTKYGIGGLQFGGQPLSTGTNGAGHYGYGGSPYGDSKSSRKYGYGGFPTGGLLLGLGKNRNTAGKYGYGRMPYEAQPAGLGPEAKSTGTYDLAGSPYQPEPLGLAQNGKYGGGDVPYAPQALGFGSEAKSSGIYDNHGQYQSQPLESVSEGRAGGEFDTAGLPYDPLPLEPDTAGKSYVKGEVPTPAIEVEGEGMPIDRYIFHCLSLSDNVGYINGQVQPEVVAFPAAPTHSSSLAYPSVPSYLPVESSFTPDVVPEAGGEDLSDPTGTASLAFDSAPATERQGGAQVPEEPDDLLQQQLPRQIHIQQHLKLHFHQQDKSGRGAKNGKYDVNGFFGNSGYQG